MYNCSVLYLYLLTPKYYGSSSARTNKDGSVAFSETRGNLCELRILPISL